MTTILTNGKTSEGTTKRCDATCHRATKPKCTCCCAGRFHGVATKASGKQAPKTFAEAESLRSGKSVIQEVLI